MSGPSPKEMTQLLPDWSKGEQEALEKLVPLVLGANLPRTSDE